ncbi:MAG: hypothetical protein ACREKL_14470, partial [Chthoniobacterales bacterium]
RLRRTRAGIVADLTERLKGIDTGTNWKSSAAPLNGNVLMMLLDLNATEALPELLRIEAILRTKIGQSPSQTAAGHNNEEITLRLLQRNILGVIATILRQERFGPFLESRVEKDYHHALKKNASAPGLKFLKNDAELTPDQLNYVYFDPIYGLPASSFTAFEVPCNDATVKQVISFAETYLKEVPASDRKGAAGMLVRPVTR